MEIWKRLVVPCHFSGHGERRLKICIEFEEDGILHMTGIGPNGCGQVLDDLRREDATPLDGFTISDLRIIYHLWNRWHLNNMRAGTPKQMAEVRALQRKNQRATYKEVCEHLKSMNLYVDDGYRYGSAWLKEDVPEKVIRWLFSLPGEGDTYEDIKSVFYNNFEISSDELLSLLHPKGVGTDGT